MSREVGYINHFLYVFMIAIILNYKPWIEIKKQRIKGVLFLRSQHAVDVIRVNYIHYMYMTLK